MPSPRAQIRDALLSGGEEAAWKVGRRLEVKGATIKAYISHFQKEKGAPKEERSSDNKSEPRRGPKLRPIKFAEGVAVGVEVFDIGLPRTWGVVKAVGPEVCQVDWPQGMRYVTTVHLRALPDDPEKRKRIVQDALDALVEIRVTMVKEWIGVQASRPTDREIWIHIREKWKHLTRDDQDEIYQRT